MPAMNITAPLTYTSPLYKTYAPKHKHYYLLALRDGAVVAVCDCGAVLDSVGIENVLNSQDVE